MKKLYLLIIVISSVISAALAQVPSQSWGNSFGGNQADSVKTSCTDPLGNYYVAGTFIGTVDFDPSGIVLSKSSVSGSTDSYIAKFNSGGILQWVSTIGGSNTDVINGMTADAGGVYVTGYFSGTANFNPSGNSSRSSQGDKDIFVAKYDLNGGNLLFVNTFGDTDSDYGTAITVNSGALYVTGAFHGEIDFDPAATGNFQTTWGGADVFLAKYNTQGSYEWAIEIGSSTSDAGTSIASDGTSVWVAGYFSDTFFPDAFDFSVSGDPVGLKDGFLSKYNVADGTFLWWGTIQSTGNDFITQLALDGNGGLYTAGQFSGTATMYGESGTSKAVTSHGATDSFIGRYDAVAMQLLWLNSFGTTIDDTIGGIAADGNSVYVAGPTGGPEDVDPSVNVVNLTNSGAYDAFFVKYNSVAGAYVTSFVIGGGSFDGGLSVTLGQGYIYYSGVFQGINIDIDPGGLTNQKNSFGSSDVFITRFAPAEPPSSPTGVTVTNVGATSAKITFNGNGGPDGYLTVFNVGSAVTGFPSDGTVYNRNDFMGGGLMGQALASGPSTSYTITGLNPSTNYFISVFSFNGTIINSGNINYRTTAPGTASFSTIALAVEPLLNPTSFQSSNLAPSSFTVSYTAPSPAPAGYIVIRSSGIGNTPNTDPSDGITYTVGSTLGNGIVAFVGSASLFNESSLDLNTTYNYKIYAFGGSGGNINYKQTAPLTGIVITPGSQEPTAQPTSLVFSSIGSTSFSYDFTASTGLNVTGYLGIIRTGIPPTFVPTDGVELAPDDVNTDGSTVAFFGIDTGYDHSGAAPGTTYYYAIYAYNGSGTGINYLQTSPLTGSVTTATPTLEPTAQPTNLVFSSIGATTFSYDFTASTGQNVAGYLGIIRTGTAPTFVPTDGIQLTQDQVNADGSTVAFIGTDTGYDHSGATPGTTYYYAIYAYNGSGTSINYLQTSPLINSVNTTALEPTAQPTALVFSQITTTGFSYDFTASTGQNVAGYIGIIRTGTAPAFVPTDGVELAPDDANADGSTVAFIGTDTGYDHTGATSGTRYYYAIYAYNGSGTGINYMQSNPLTGNVTTLGNAADTSKPVIHDNTQATITPNSDLLITADITDTGSGVDNVYVEFYPINSSDYGNEYMTLQSGTTYTYQISSSYNTEQGIEYKIHAVDVAGNEQETQWKSVVRSYSGNGLSIPYSAGSAQANYRIISVPLDLTRKTVNDVFEELGAYDKTKYRLFHYASNNVAELSGTSSIELGKGYWFIATQQKTINSGPGTTAQTGIGNNVTISITNGWNQIGNPYNFDVDWNKVVVNNADKTLGQFKTYDGSFSNASTLRTMSGGFVMVSAAGDNKLFIPVDKDARTAAPAPPVNFRQTINSDTWGVDILVRSGEMENTFAGFGMHPEASEQTDKYDDYTLPRFLDYLELNYNKKLYGSPFTRDVVPTSAQYVWEFKVASNLADDVVDLSWDNSYFGSSDLQLVLWDVNQQRAVDMKAQRMYSFERSLSGTFKIFYGSDSFVKQETLPDIAIFHSVSPVPASGNVTFAFSVPESNGEVNTNLSVYNSLGQRVWKLVDGNLSGGYHQAVWEIEGGTKPAAGVYISVLKFGDTTLQKRLIIK